MPQNKYQMKMVADNDPRLVGSGLTPEIQENKNQPNGYAGLDANGLIPESEIPDLARYAIRLDPEEGFPAFLGRAAIGSAESASTWEIRKITDTGNILAVIWANGNGDFDKSWNNRATYSYS